ncbi:MAG: WhiB family transcriptional regulator [Nocardioides sp.]
MRTPHEQPPTQPPPLPVLTDEDTPMSWAGQALCAEVDPELFFPEKGGSSTAARRLCAACPVLDECRTWTQILDPRYGVWAGTTETDRRKQRRRDRRRSRAAARAGDPS